MTTNNTTTQNVALTSLCACIKSMPIEQRIHALNEAKIALHEISPFSNEPVDCVLWVKNEIVVANDYNPNSVAPPEMELLRHSIREDGYTQPIVSMPAADKLEVIDGFHRHRVGKECDDIRERVHGYLPVVHIRKSREDKTDRMASTIRHNRARGKHKVEAMSDIVIELKRRNWSEDKIARELGMDADEVLRLCQITGLAEAFKDQHFSSSWEIKEGQPTGKELLTDSVSGVDVDDGGRIFHTWEKWECYRAGFYAERPPEGITQEAGEIIYRDFLSDMVSFEAALKTITEEWKFSCEHYLTNERMNRIAWLGQAAVALSKGIPSGCRGGYSLLTEEQKNEADKMALKYLNLWLSKNGRSAVTIEGAGSKTEAELY